MPKASLDAAPGRRTDSECDSRASVGDGIIKKVEVEAILPDICCRLVNRDGGEVATLSLALNSFVKVPQGERCQQLQLENSVLASLPPALMDTSMMVRGAGPYYSLQDRSLCPQHSFPLLS